MTRTTNPIQVIYIHGGMTFNTKEEYLEWLKTREVTLENKSKWSDSYLAEALGQQFTYIKPRMPCGDDAKYAEWKLHFERLVPLMNPQVVLIGCSLGGIFLAKYLSEHKFPKNILATFLVAPPFDNSLPGEALAGGFELPHDLSLLQKNSQQLHMMFSRDDDVVPLDHAQKYKAELPHAQFHFYDRVQGHFTAAEFPEIVELIKKVSQK